MGLQIAVDVSMDKSTGLDYSEAVARILRDSGMSLLLLVLDMTESRLMRDPAAALDMAPRLQLSRIGLSIDDLSNGNSSLGQLRHTPFDDLKLDHGSVGGISSDPAHAAFVDGGLSMARRTGPKAVAEGPGRYEDWAYLMIRGCDMAQGNLIARSMPADPLAEWGVGWALRYTQLAVVSR